MSKQHEVPSYLTPSEIGPWGVYLEQIDRVTPYLGSLARWVETLKRPKRILVVDASRKYHGRTDISMSTLPFWPFWERKSLTTNWPA